MVRIQDTYDSPLVQIKNLRFLRISVASMVPKLPKSNSIDLKIYDELNAEIPFQLLKNVVATYMHRKGFRLRIALCVEVAHNQSGDNHKITSVRLFATNLSDGNFIRE